MSSNATNDAANRRFMPLGVKLTVPIVLLTGLVGWGTYQGLLRTSRSNLLQSKEAAADMVTKLFAASITPAVVFNDDTEMQRCVADLARNREVMDVELWPVASSDEASKLLVEFHRNPGQLGRPDGVGARRKLASAHLDVVEPILDSEKKPIALATVRFSLAREQAVLSDIAKKTLYVASGVGLALTAALMFMLAKIVVVPLGRLKRAAMSLREGARQSADITSAGFAEDEVGQLGRVFVAMADAVADREARLAVRNDELRLILDNVHQGFLTLTPDGTIQNERSAIVERWVGALPEGTKLWDLVARLDPAQGILAELNWAQLADGLLPVDLCIDQLPARLVKAGQYFSLQYRPVFEGGNISRVVVVLSDITDEVERRRVEEDQKEFATLVDRLVRDRGGFLEFWKELGRLVDRLLDPTTTTLKRELHTVKGNSRFFGMWRLSDLCHRLEDALQERQEHVLTDEERTLLRVEWEGIRSRVDVLTEEASAFLELSETDYERLGTGLRTRTSHEILAQVVSEFHYEPTRRRLERSKDIVEASCRKAGKPVASVVIEDNGLKLPKGRWGEFWAALTHVLTNAVEHGLETAPEREACGKPAAGSVTIRTTTTSTHFVVEVVDDGRGIDWERVRAEAQRRNLPYASSKDLEQALLHDGFSTKDQVTDMSGRGVGLGAVSHCVRELGGVIELTTAVGKGTTWRFAFPVAATREPPRPSLMPPRGRA